MKRIVLAGAVLAFACIATAQGFDPTTPDGSMIGSIQKETDAGKKQALLKDFVHQFPDSQMAGWAWSQLQAGFLQAQQYDEALAAGEKALVSDPNSIDAAYSNLKAAEAKNDPEGVLKWSAQTSEIARKQIQETKTGATADYAKQVDTYTEYSSYAMVLRTADPAKIIALVESLEQRSPESAYLSKSYGPYLNALRQSGQGEKAGAAAIREAQRDPSNEDALLVAADYSSQQKDNEKTLLYSSQVATLMQSKPKPEGMAEADWQKKKQTLLGVAYWLEGISYNSERRFKEGDTALRNALPLVKTDNRLLPLVLLQLGVADFQLGKSSKNTGLVKDALKFSQQSAALKSTVQAEAQNNVKAISRSLGAGH